MKKSILLSALIAAGLAFAPLASAAFADDMKKDTMDKYNMSKDTMKKDVIPLDAALVKGSHGRQPAAPGEWPVLISSCSDVRPGPLIESTEVFELLKKLMFGQKK